MHIMDIKFIIDWQLSQADNQKIDPQLFSLLEAIQQLGSLKKATEKIHVSYRFSWGLLTKWNEYLGQPLVILERGRGATLSPLGEKLLNANVQLNARFSPELDNFASQFSHEFEALLDKDKTPSLKIFASHGLAIATLRDLIHQQLEFKLDLHFHGSLESLRALNNGECDIAGFHIPVGKLSKSLAPHYLKLLNGKKHQLIYIVKRNQGLIVQQGNPKNIHSINSLTNDNIEFINRQTDSGTRLLFDQLLHANNINSNGINGYQNEEFTHMAVAAMIASGAADVGFGIASMADKFKLDFIPVVWEHYCLAIPLHLVHDERTRLITSLLHNDAFKYSLAQFSGYDTLRAGETVTFKEIFG